MSRSEQLANARRVLASAMEDPLCDAYRKRFLGHEDTISDVIEGKSPWGMVPFMTRDFLSSTPWRSRCGIRQEAIDTFRVTSGTSGKPLIVPRAMGLRETITDPLHGAVYVRNNISKMATMSSGHAQHARYFSNANIASIGLDPGAPQQNARIIETWKPDMIAGFAYGMSPLAEHLSTDTRMAVRAVQIFGERSSPLIWKQLHDLFPRAEVFSEYASIEAQTSLGVGCKHIIDAVLPYIHPFDTYVFMEVIDPETGVEVERVGQSGELVITVLRKTAFPLIRYRTGDRVSIQETTCQCGKPTYSVDGRIAAERLRIAGGEINIFAIERALTEIREMLVSPIYEASIAYVAGVHAVSVPQLTLSLHLKDPDRHEQVCAIVSKQLMVSPTASYGDLCKSDVLAPLVVRPVSAVHQKQGRITISP
jgi:phenylacetate-CoA ligase